MYIEQNLEQHFKYFIIEILLLIFYILFHTIYLYGFILFACIWIHVYGFDIIKGEEYKMKLGFRERERYSKYFQVVLTLARKIYETVRG